MAKLQRVEPLTRGRRRVSTQRLEPTREHIVRVVPTLHLELSVGGTDTIGQIQPVPRSGLDPTSLAGRVSQHLLDLIIEGVLKPGERVTERDLAERLLVGATPAREAIKRQDVDEQARLGLEEIDTGAGRYHAK